MRIFSLKMVVLALLCGGGSLWAQQATAQAERDDAYGRTQRTERQRIEQKGYYLTPQSHFFGSRVFKAFMDDHCVVGYFGTNNTDLVLLKENGQYFVNATPHWNRFASRAIPEKIGQAMEAVLKNEVFNTTTYSAGGLGGSLCTFGVKQEGRWALANIWMPPSNSIGALMGEIAQLGDCKVDYREKGYIHYGEWGDDRLTRLAYLLRCIDAFYAKDKRPRLDDAAARAYDAERSLRWDDTKEREAAQVEAGIIRLEGKVTAEIIVPETGDLRLKLGIGDLPEDHGLMINTTEDRNEFYFVLDYLDKNDAPRRQRVILNNFNDMRENVVPLTAGMEVSLEEISPRLREAVLKICPDPEKVQGLALMVETLTVIQPLDAEKLPEKYRRYARNRESVLTELQVLPIENLRKNLRVKSVPLSRRVNSSAIAKDEQGRLAEYTNQHGDHFKVVYSGETDAAYDNPEKMGLNNPLKFLAGVASVVKNGTEIYAGRVLEDGLQYCATQNETGPSFSLREGDGKPETRCTKNMGGYVVEYRGGEIRYAPLAQVRLADGEPLPKSPEALRVWKERFEAVRVGIELEMEDGEPCLYLLLENTTGKPIALNEAVKISDNLMLEYKKGGSGLTCLRDVELVLPQTTLTSSCRIKIPEFPLAFKQAYAQAEAARETAGRARDGFFEGPPKGVNGWHVTVSGLEKNEPRIQRASKDIALDGEAFRQFYDRLPYFDSSVFKARQQAQVDAIRASAGFEMEGGEPCFYIDLENTTGTPIELAKTADFHDEFWAVRGPILRSGIVPLLYINQLILPQGPLTDKCRIKIPGIPEAIKGKMKHFNNRPEPIMAFEWKATISGVERNLPVSNIARTTQPITIEGEDLRQLLEYLEKLPEPATQ